METMSAEFTKSGPNMAKSSKGFSVTFHPPAGVDYVDVTGIQIRVDTELYVNPLRHILYAESKDLTLMDRSRADAILNDVLRAMIFLGHPAEISKTD